MPAEATATPPQPARLPAREVLANPWVWASLGALFAVQLTGTLAANWSLDLPDLLRVMVVDGGGWLVVSALACVLAWLLPLDEGRWAWSLPLVAACGLATTWLRLEVGCRLLVVPWPAWYGFLLLFPVNLLLFMGIVGSAHAIFYFFRSRDAEQVASRLEAALARANLQLLEMQMDPHFLFNALNSVGALMQRDREAAVDLIGALRRLLARDDARAARQTVPLFEELELVRVYLQIEQRRLGPRLRVEWRVDPGACAAAVPRLVLQTLAENAVRHGVAPLRRGGTVEIGARPEGARLQAWVSDDGVGLRAGGAGRGGIGLGNTEARLRHLYGGDHRFEVRTRAGGGVQAWIDIPFTRGHGDAAHG